MDVEIVSIGDEVLRGRTVNGNAAFLSALLTEMGYSIVRQTTLPDRVEMIRAGLHDARKRAGLVVVTGGLGPIIDDLTCDAALPLFNEKPAELKNRIGTAMGLFGSGYLLLPGVPSEMEIMFKEEALPLLQINYPVRHPIFSQTCTLCLLRELEVGPFLRTLQAPGLEIGIYPSYGSLQVVFRSERPVDDLIGKIEKKFPTFFMGIGKVEEAVHREMIARKKTVSFAESCTGGAIAARIAAIPDASLFFSGSIVAYSNIWKERFLKVRHDTLSRFGAVSAETVKEMAEGIFEETESDYAVAVSGILGPKGAVSGKPVGTVFLAIAKRGEEIDIGRISVPKDRSAGIEMTIQTALGALWRRLVHNTATFS